ncbi:MAG: NADH-quinone oxidoreductase subunit A [Actinomycetota bacterium]|nr:NADH-quinone oxidoreductase subunit A [Actinomycetota bacterium]
MARILAAGQPVRGMSTYFESYLTVGAFVAMGAVLVMGMLGVASILRPSNPTKAKKMTYECGVDPVGTGWSQTYIRYYVFGLLFVIFDVEAVFIFPWAIKLEDLGMFGLVEMLIFIAILVLGLVYAIRKGVLQWE